MDAITLRGLDDVRSLLAGLSGELADVGRMASDKMAYELRMAEQDQMRRDIDRPTPFSVSAVAYKKSNVSAMQWGGPSETGASVFMHDNFARQGTSRVGPDQYLGVQVTGGYTAGPRRSEKVLRAAGLIGPNKVIVPAPGVKLNAYGNLSAGQISRILMDLGQNQYAKTKQRNFALFGPKGNAVGVLARVKDGDGWTWLPYLYFVDRRQYRKRFDFYGRAEREVSARFKEIFGGYLDRALARMARSV